MKEIIGAPPIIYHEAAIAAHVDLINDIYQKIEIESKQGNIRLKVENPPEAVVAYFQSKGFVITDSKIVKSDTGTLVYSSCYICW